MTDHDKISLLNFIVRPGMFVPTVKDTTIVSFIGGYEIGTNRCDFTTQLKCHLKDNLKIEYSSDGWPGQIKKYANKKSISWIIAFQQLGLEILASEKGGGLNAEMKDILKKRIEGLIDRISESGAHWFKEHWIDDCISFLAIKSIWFNKLWSEEEFRILKSIISLIKKEQVFEDQICYQPTQAVLKLKSRFICT